MSDTTLRTGRDPLRCANADCDFATNDADAWHLHAMNDGHFLDLEQEDDGSPEDRLDELVSAMVGVPTDDHRVDVIARLHTDRDMIYGSHWSAAFIETTACAWHLSRSSGVALVVAADPGASGRSPVEWQRSVVQGQCEENSRRDRMTLQVCDMVLMAYTNSRWVFLGLWARAMGLTPMIENLVTDSIMPSYTEMRNFLVGEYDAHYVIASAAAFRQVAWHARFVRKGWLGAVEREWRGRYVPIGDRWWL